MASRASLLLMLQAFLLALALSGCMQNVSGLEETTTGDAVPEQPLPKSSFIRRQLAEKPQKGNGLFFGTPPAPKTCFPPCLFGFTCCFPFCFDLQKDPLHCGTCTTACNLVLQKCCSGKCVNYLTDPNNCGLCGKKCLGVCKGGLCNYNGKFF